MDEWVHTLKILFDLLGDLQPRESSYGVSEVCNLPVSLWDHTHPHTQQWSLKDIYLPN